jgi:hypothetical protein
VRAKKPARDNGKNGVAHRPIARCRIRLPPSEYHFNTMELLRFRSARCGSPAIPSGRLRRRLPTLFLPVDLRAWTAKEIVKVSAAPSAVARLRKPVCLYRRLQTRRVFVRDRYPGDGCLPHIASLGKRQPEILRGRTEEEVNRAPAAAPNRTQGRSLGDQAKPGPTLSIALGLTPPHPRLLPLAEQVVQDLCLASSKHQYDVLFAFERASCKRAGWLFSDSPRIGRRKFVHASAVVRGQNT